MPEEYIEQTSAAGIENIVVLPITGRIAAYDNLRSIPRIIDFNYESIVDYLNEIPQKTYSLSHEMGGKIPYTIIKEVIENLIHARFKEVIITIMEQGNHIIVTDQGPGIIDKQKAFLPGYTSASESMKKYIRGVGSGLPIVKETIVFSGGTVDIEDNINHGTVVSLKIESVADSSLATNQGLFNDYAANAVGPDSSASTVFRNTGEKDSYEKIFPGSIENIKLSVRQIKILSLILEFEEIGPSKIATELSFSLSTSYRELIFLESIKLLEMTESGKRRLTKRGKKYLEYYSNNF